MLRKDPDNIPMLRGEWRPLPCPSQPIAPGGQLSLAIRQYSRCSMFGKVAHGLRGVEPYKR
jgi:hypothetical protein